MQFTDNDAIIKLKEHLLKFLLSLTERDIEFENIEVFYIGIMVGTLLKLTDFTKEENEILDRIVKPFYK
jgi:hypothetical protein